MGVFFVVYEYVKNFEFLGCVENVLGICEWLELKGYKYVVIFDKDGFDFGMFFFLRFFWLFEVKMMVMEDMFWLCLLE